MSRVEMQLTTEASHFLESQRQVLSAWSKSSSPQKPLTLWRAKDSIISKVQIQLTIDATHKLDRQGQAL